MSATTSVRARVPVENCEHCGTGLGGLSYCKAVDAWICFGCFSRTRTPIEPVGPIEPSRSSSSTLSVDGSKNGSMGVEVTRPDGSMGVDQTAARVSALGIRVSLGEDFDCILPGHEGRARVHSTSRGFWKYQCADTTLGLAEVRACAGYGTVRRISKLEAARWRERLDYEAGLREARKVDLSLPERMSDSARLVAAGLELYLGLRDTRWCDQPFTWAREFVMAWCGVTDQQAREAVEQLREAKVLRPTGQKCGRAILYRAGLDTAEAFMRAYGQVAA